MFNKNIDFDENINELINLWKEYTSKYKSSNINIDDEQLKENAVMSFEKWQANMGYIY